MLPVLQAVLASEPEGWERVLGPVTHGACAPLPDHSARKRATQRSRVLSATCCLPVTWHFKDGCYTCKLLRGVAHSLETPNGHTSLANGLALTSACVLATPFPRALCLV